MTLVVSGRTVRESATPDVPTAQKHDDAAASITHVPLDTVQVGGRIGDTAYRLLFPEGGLAVTGNHGAVEAAFRLMPSSHWLARMEQVSWVVVVAMVGLERRFILHIWR